VAIMTTAAQRQYRDYLSSPRWRTLRSLRRRIDRNRCRTCGATGRLEVHHSTYQHRGVPGLRGWLRELRDVITLCDDCHGKVHDK
jgi:5-methylcytosine-specific restriction endonuclease McrA